jgi:hypothetical protein
VGPHYQPDGITADLLDSMPVGTAVTMRWLVRETGRDYRLISRALGVLRRKGYVRHAKADRWTGTRGSRPWEFYVTRRGRELQARIGGR